MQIAIFGLGRMGGQIARRLHKNGFTVLAWNRSEGPRQEVAAAGVQAFAAIPELVGKMDQEPRVFWLMLPQAIVDEFLNGQLGPHLRAGDIVVDGGNSFYKDSMRRAAELEKKGVHFFDCGTSGGVWGEENGFALMVGGPKEQWPQVEKIFQVLSSGHNYGLVGKNGAGHFVKMVHNGIEYGMMEAIAEGYGVMQASEFGLDLGQVTGIYQEGSVVRSWLIDLTRNIFEQEDVAGTSGVIAATGEGEWTVNAGKELGVDVRVIEDALQVRRESEQPENRNKFSNKIVALLRKQFGGHGVQSKN
ncbi:MAG TPA: decarboxylating 6-phosphogluconate dehydrogenase [Patescibacteria group bacterium]|nr:decarboxylating 6-phosphogluconate dehydrogenase [Patescibacteria group bacterium]